MSERQKARARWLRWVKVGCVCVSCALLVWAGYALVTYKPEKFGAPPQNPRSSLSLAGAPKPE